VKPWLLDLYCGAGGAAMGYHRAGFEVVGVDIKPQPRYPFEFHQGDALEYLLAYMEETDLERPYFDAIHASPPCQAHTRAQRLRGNDHEDLISPTRELLEQTGLPYVIENVPGAPLHRPVVLCVAGSHRYDGFELRRHRLFETNWLMNDLTPPCSCGEFPAAPVFGHSANAWFREKYGRNFNNDAKRQIMGTPWMTGKEVAQAIPPALTELIGHQLMQHVLSTRDASETQSA
jgi:DNA (cytosine-5)-methyltransferase 1